MLSTDILIVGAGIAGAGLAAAIDGRRDVILLEQEARPGHHSTGRSAAIFIQNYGNAVIRALSAASRPLFDMPEPEYFPEPLLSPRGILFVAGKDDLGDHEALLAESDGLVPFSAEGAAEMVPLLDPSGIVASAYEPDASDIDVNALHQGWLRKARGKGCVIQLDAALTGARRSAGKWLVETSAGAIEANVIVNAAGAWADTVAAACEVPRVGLVPMRRTMAVLPCPDGYDCRHWPLVSSSGDHWYFKPDAGRLLVSPGDEDPVEPHDAFVDDMVLAEGLDRYQQAVLAEVTRVETSWAGLRTFAPDRTPVVGFDAGIDGFFWLAGQGGYGIQTSPALSQVASNILLGEELPASLAAAAEAMSPRRFPQ
ncbi:FAD-binding oxidoreductase [Mesorhizobium sp. CAU 1741]|uniref:NAD(P)/FAD-dependent oxidoreductase n=1 Tax=Mesorhizobium sp. CAU 1741 TaxID=3140366 RepID=UPI00325BFBBD